ncbi:SGNH/GDSL hydrolase family protein [Microbacterium sp. SLBN-146]|uniref:SGNH/GDSL hydrolase family protein n=1 Tax=Microbacterium sp. SLBN-146 TaxID=2768457 RepID=UPI00114F140B|nr:SGNH/GDSL hydrolase family protein [Microbacterium sp. SLBN-146]TQJ32595.1 lysophospholipase L1-like esterase [Microbacterium sp. SLBN-146]
MNPTGRSRWRRSWLPLGIIALAVALVCVLGAARPWASGPAPVAAPVDAAPAPAPLALPDDATVLIFGDSWVYGAAAITPTRGFAYLTGETLGWQTIVDGVSGSGYLKPGLTGPAYPERIAALDPGIDPDLIIVEGSINDRRLPAEGYRETVNAAWNALAEKYPDARIVIMGPAPQVLPVEKATARIDQDLAELAAARGWWYISPLADDWITTENYRTVIDTSDLGRNHPSTEGHAYLAERLVDAIERLSGAGTVAADGLDLAG